MGASERGGGQVCTRFRRGPNLGPWGRASGGAGMCGWASGMGDTSRSRGPCRLMKHNAQCHRHAAPAAPRIDVMSLGSAMGRPRSAGIGGPKPAEYGTTMKAERGFEPPSGRFLLFMLLSTKNDAPWQGASFALDFRPFGPVTRKLWGVIIYSVTKYLLLRFPKVHDTR